IAGMDVSHRALEIATERLDGKARIFQGSLLYRDPRLAGWDAAACVEVIEHLDPSRLAAFERVVFAHARPGTVVVTTPNAEWNVKLPSPGMRHADHRFEWTRAELAAWATRVAEQHGYQIRVLPIGAEDPDVGAPTQMAVFTR